MYMASKECAIKEIVHERCVYSSCERMMSRPYCTVATL